MARRDNGTVIAPPPVRTRNQEEDEEEARERAQRSWIMSFVKDNWFMGLLAGIAIWFLGFTEQGKEAWAGIKEFFSGFAEKFIDWLPISDETKGNIKGFLSKFLDVDVKKEALGMKLDEFQKEFAKGANLDLNTFKALVPDEPKRKALVELIANANDGKFRLGDLHNDKTIYALMTQRPDIVQAIAKANLTPGKDEKLPGDAQKILGSLKAIVASDRLDALVTTHAATTTALLKALKPENAGEIDLMMKHGSVELDKATPAFRTLLTKMLTVTDGKRPDKATTDAAIAEYKTATPKLEQNALNEFFNTDEGRKFKGNNNGAAYNAMVAAAGSESNLKPILVGFKERQNNLIGQMQFVLQNRKVFDAYRDASKDLPEEYKRPLDRLGKIPEEATEPLVRIMSRIDPTPLLDLAEMKDGFTAGKITQLLLLNPKLGEALVAAGPADVVEVARAYAKKSNTSLPEGFSAETMVAMINTAKKVNLPQPVDPEKLKSMTIEEKMKAAPADIATKREDTVRFLAAITEKLGNKKNPDKAVVSYLTPDALARFMRDEKNAAAFWETIGGLRGLSDKDEKTVMALLKRKDAITDVARDAGNGAPLVIKYLDKLGGDNSCEKIKESSGISFFDTFSLSGWNSLGRNSKALEELAQEITSIQCGSPVGPAVLPKPPTGFGQGAFGWR